MRVMILVKANDDSEAGKPPGDRLLSGMGRFNEELIEKGALVEGGGLQASSQGVRVRFSNGRFTVTPGPFTPARDVVAGYWVIHAKSMKDAIEWAKKIPFEEGEVELRPIFELEDFPVDPAEKPDGWRKKEEEFRAKPPPAPAAGMARYMGLLKADRGTEAGVMPAEKLLAAMGEFFDQGVKAGVVLGGEGLQPSSKGARVRYSGENRTVIDGPFPETKELVAGYAVLQFASKEEALDWTRRFVQVDAPGRLNSESECELRPLM